MPEELMEWTITPYEVYPGARIAESTEGHTLTLTGSHCLACAYAKLVTEYGGTCDLRGLHRYRDCYGFLQLIVLGNRREAKEARKKERGSHGK